MEGQPVCIRFCDDARSQKLLLDFYWLPFLFHWCRWCSAYFYPNLQCIQDNVIDLATVALPTRTSQSYKARQTCSGSRKHQVVRVTSTFCGKYSYANFHFALLVNKYYPVDLATVASRDHPQGSVQRTQILFNCHYVSFIWHFLEHFLLIGDFLIANNEISSTVHPVADNVEMSQSTSEKDVTNRDATPHGAKIARNYRDIAT